MTAFCSPSVVNLAKALLQVQERLKPVVKDETNGFLKTRYATLANVLEAVRRPLLDNGVLLIQRAVESPPGTVAVETRLIHCSGEWMAGVTVIPLPEAEPGSRVNAGQAVGAAISYARRYGLMAMLSLAAVDEDTDNELRQEKTVLPDLPNVTYEDALSENGEPIVIARGQTMPNKEALKRSGFRWNPERKCWAAQSV